MSFSLFCREQTHAISPFEFQLFCYDTAGLLWREMSFPVVEAGSTHSLPRHYSGLLIDRHCICGCPEKTLSAKPVWYLQNSVCHGACQNIVYGMHLVVALYPLWGGCRAWVFSSFQKAVSIPYVFEASIFGSLFRELSMPTPNVPVVGVRNFSWRDSCSVIYTFTLYRSRLSQNTGYRSPSFKETGCVFEAGSSCCSPLLRVSPVILVNLFPGRKTMLEKRCFP